MLVPIYNETDNIVPLINEIRAALDDKIAYELIYVDDGSNDNSWQQEKVHVRLLQGRRNNGT